MNDAIEYIREGDILVVWKLDRLGRSLKHLIEIVGELEKGKIGFKSLRESIDTTSPGGRLIFHAFGALAEFEREIIRERTNAGLSAARARGEKRWTPLKKIPETDEISEALDKIHEESANSDQVARLSIDCKDRIKIGTFSRGGKSRVKTEASDHDFGDEYLTPFGILDVTSDELDLSLAQGPVTADFMIDRIRKYWVVQKYNKTKKVLVLNADNGPENNSRRTQFMKRIIEFCIEFDVTIILAYYPPYYSKYNKIERVWRILEQHINGDLMEQRNYLPCSYSLFRFSYRVT